MHRHPLGAKRRARVPEFVNKNRRVPDAEAAAVLQRRLGVGPRMLSGAWKGAVLYDASIGSAARRTGSWPRRAGPELSPRMAGQQKRKTPTHGRGFGVGYL